LIAPLPRIRVRTWLNLRHFFACVYNTRYTVVTLGREQKKRKTAASLIASPIPAHIQIPNLTQFATCWACIYNTLYALVANVGVCTKVDFRGREKRKGIQTKKHLGEPRSQSLFVQLSRGSRPAAVATTAPPLNNSGISCGLWGRRRRSTLVRPSR
jgi:hypothetical protein